MKRYHLVSYYWVSVGNSEKVEDIVDLVLILINHSVAKRDLLVNSRKEAEEGMH